MPRHEIEAGLPAHCIVNTDVKVIVKSDGTELGELLISKGSIDWRPSKHLASYKMTWELQDDVGEVREVYGGEHSPLRLRNTSLTLSPLFRRRNTIRRWSTVI